MWRGKARLGRSSDLEKRGCDPIIEVYLVSFSYSFLGSSMGTGHREAVGKRTQGGEVEKHTTGVGVVMT